MRTTSLATALISIGISVLFWGLILITHFAQVGGGTSTAIALGLGWFFIGCPIILGLSIVSLVTAFKKAQRVQGAIKPAPDMFAPKLMSITSLAALIIPFLVGVFGPTVYNSFL